VDSPSLSPLPLAGIYAITHLQSRKVYVGSARNLARRWLVHKSRLNVGSHYSNHLQLAWHKYGADAFEFSVLEYIDDVHKLVSREQHWLDALQAVDSAHGHNSNPTAGSRLGAILSAESRHKIGAKKKGIPLCEELRAKLSAARTGRRMPAQTRLAISRAWIGREHTSDSKAKMSAAKKGKHCGEASNRAKLASVDVVRIRELLSHGIAAKAIARQFMVSDFCVRQIKEGKTWRHVHD
jgi:group I intron endonuclease